MAHAKASAVTSSLGLLVLLGGALALRWTALHQGGFASHDVAGILYNAMLLAHGDLPYRESVELKAPGSFYLAWWLAEGGRSIARFQVWANLWALAGIPVVYLCARRAWSSSAAGLTAALVYLFVSAHLDSMDANYVTWAQAPSLVCLWATLEAREEKGSKRFRWLAAAGVAAGIAALMKRPNAVVVILPVAIALSRGEKSKRQALMVVAGGIAIGQAPVWLHYALGGDLRALLEGYLLSKWGLRYIGAAAHPDSGPAVLEALRATWAFLGLPLVLGVVAGLSGWMARRGRPPPESREPSDRAGESMERSVGFVLGLALLAGLVSTWPGARFYKGYFLLPAGPACVVAGAVAPMLQRAWAEVGEVPRSRARLQRGLVLMLALGGALPLTGRELGYALETRANRGRAHDAGARRIARYLSPRRSEEGRIWVWGWHLWDLYPMLGARSGSRIYKSLGLLTPPNDDTWRLAPSRLRWVEGPASEQLLKELRASQPEWIVLGSTAPWREFPELRAFLDAHYLAKRGPKIGRVAYWRLREESS